MRNVGQPHNCFMPQPHKQQKITQTYLHLGLQVAYRGGLLELLQGELGLLQLVLPRQVSTSAEDIRGSCEDARQQRQ